MSGGLSNLALSESDVKKFLASNTHLGSNSVNFQMKQYVFRRRADGINLISIKDTYEKLLIAARAIAAIENPADVYVISSRPMGQRAVLKFARYVGATPIAGRFTPGAFTNQIQAAFREPRLLVITDPLQDHQPILEAAYVNIPVIGFCNTDSPLRFVDIAIPCNNKSAQAVGLMWWMLAREVLSLRGTISRNIPWENEVMPDLFFYRDPEEQEKEEQAKAEAAKEVEAPKVTPFHETWSADPEPSAAAVPAPTGPAVSDDWGQSVATEDWVNPSTEDWGAAAATAAVAADTSASWA